MCRAADSMMETAFYSFESAVQSGLRTSSLQGSWSLQAQRPLNAKQISVFKYVAAGTEINLFIYFVSVGDRLGLQVGRFITETLATWPCCCNKGRILR